jgi:lipopolysaccharide transport system ATP-binding protein
VRRGLADALLRPYRWLRGHAHPKPLAGSSETFWALKDISFDLERGERLGIIGRNGAGKSTLLKILSRIVYPTEGEARLRGRVTSLLEVGTGFNMELTGRENVYLNAALHGLERREVDARLEEIIDFSGIGDFLDTPVKHYSSGMFMRLAFSVAAHLDPDILLLDEVLAVGDLSFQQKCLNRIEGLTSEGRTILFVSHSMDAITRFCTRAIWLDRGRIVCRGPVQDVIDAYVEEVLQVISNKRWLPEQGDVARGETDDANGQGAGGNDVDGAIRTDAVASLLGVSMENGRVASCEPSALSDAALTKAQSEMGEPAREKAVEQPAAFLAMNAPGDDHIRLVSARVVNKNRETIVSINVDEPVGLEMVYEVLKEEKLLLPAFRFFSGAGVHLFNAVYTDPNYMQVIKPPGRYVSRAWIPANLLNSGLVYVTLAVSTPGPQLERHFVVERAISFHVHDVFKIEETARGLYTREFPGAVRPKLEWETQRVR